MCSKISLKNWVKPSHNIHLQNLLNYVFDIWIGPIMALNYVLLLV
jgi:hypothetical protein